ncbi:MAG: thioredoxin family protein [Pseudomonadota bacterium]
MLKIAGGLRSAFIAAAIVIAGLVPAAWASTPYSEAAFKSAQASGAPILVEIHASWCSTCKAQAPIIGDLAAQPKFKNLKVFRVDFDGQRSDVRKFSAQSQSTLIVFKGGAEVGRSVGDTKRDSITTLLNKGL